MPRTTPISLDDMTIPEMMDLARRLETEIAEKRHRDLTAFAGQCWAKCDELGVTAKDLIAVLAAGEEGKECASRKRKGVAVAVAYKGPAGQVWSGRGKTPVWLRELEDAGKSRDAYKVS